MSKDAMSFIMSPMSFHTSPDTMSFIMSLNVLSYVTRCHAIYHVTRCHVVYYVTGCLVICHGCHVIYHVTRCLVMCLTDAMSFIMSIDVKPYITRCHHTKSYCVTRLVIMSLFVSLYLAKDNWAVVMVWATISTWLPWLITLRSNLNKDQALITTLI